MIGFLIGLFIGGFAGVAVMALLNVASEADHHIDEQSRNAEA
ncbi:DUF3789 domain-containing protein [uncultured Ruminococcus sp.]|nr:DUF3789 domain-containing protein [uncultured Ruminococcus sp.]